MLSTFVGLLVYLFYQRKKNLSHFSLDISKVIYSNAKRVWMCYKDMYDMRVCGKIITCHVEISEVFFTYVCP